MPHVIVVGAGIVGAATAFYLRLAGARVTVIDAKTPSAGATGASDGAVSVASKRPGVMMQLARQSRDLYARLVQEDVLAGLFHTRPTYLFARTAAEVDLIRSQERDLNEQGEPTLWLERADLLKRVPGLGSSVLAGLKVPHDGHAIGYQITHRFLSCADVEPLRHTAAQELIVSGDRVVGLQTSAGRMMADVVVMAAGIDSNAFVGLDTVMIPRKGQLVVTDRAAMKTAMFPGPLMSAGYLAAKLAAAPGHSSVNLVIDPLSTGQFLLGSSREDGVTDRQTDAHTVAAILREAVNVYPPLAKQRVIRTLQAFVRQRKTVCLSSGTILAWMGSSLRRPCRAMASASVRWSARPSRAWPAGWSPHKISQPCRLIGFRRFNSGRGESAPEMLVSLPAGGG